jgi:hypothetical protein
MPWPPKQRAAIAASLARKGKTSAEISAFFRAHGYGKGHQTLMKVSKERKR